MKTFTPYEELEIINEMILDYQRKKFKAKTPEDKQDFIDMLKVAYDMKEVRRKQIEILEAYNKLQTA
jgi:hypothetical protein